MHWSCTNTERCICVARKMQIFLAWYCNASKAGKWQTNKCIEERWFCKSFSLCVFLKCKIQQVVLECNIMQKSCRNTQSTLLEQSSTPLAKLSTLLCNTAQFTSYPVHYAVNAAQNRQCIIPSVRRAETHNTVHYSVATSGQ